MKEGSTGNENDKDFAQIDWINILTQQKNLMSSNLCYNTINLEWS